MDYGQSNPNDSNYIEQGISILFLEMEAMIRANEILELQGIRGSILDLAELEMDSSKLWLEEFRSSLEK